MIKFEGLDYYLRVKNAKILISYKFYILNTSVIALRINRILQSITLLSLEEKTERIRALFKFFMVNSYKDVFYVAITTKSIGPLAYLYLEKTFYSNHDKTDILNF